MFFVTKRALAIILAARRIQKIPIPAVGTVVAALAAALASAWILSWGTRIAFEGMIALDSYSQFFKVLISATLAIAPSDSLGHCSV